MRKGTADLFAVHPVQGCTAKSGDCKLLIFEVTGKPCFQVTRAERSRMDLFGVSQILLNQKHSDRPRRPQATLNPPLKAAARLAVSGVSS
jgi:hypothetical protein